MSQILNDQIERWANDMSSLLTSPFDFLNFFGVNQISETDARANENVMSRISEFVLFVGGLDQVLKRVSIDSLKINDTQHVALREGKVLVIIIVITNE